MLWAVRSGRWKLLFEQGGGPAALYALDIDIGETNDVARANPEVVERLVGLADEMRRELGDAAIGRKGSGVRPVGRFKGGG